MPLTLNQQGFTGLQAASLSTPSTTRDTTPVNYSVAILDSENDVTTTTNIPDESYFHFVHLCPVKCYYVPRRIETTNLFAHPFYYLQNGYNNLIDAKTEEGRTAIDVSRRCRALLFLHTIPINFDDVSSVNTKLKSYFNNKETHRGGIELVPYGYLLLVGGLIWRKRYIDSHNNADPIRYWDTSGNKLYNHPKDNTNLGTHVYDPLFVNISGKPEFVLMKPDINEDTKYKGIEYNIRYDTIVGTNNKPLVENRLVELFEKFADTEFPTLTWDAELKVVYNDPSQGPADKPTNNETITFPLAPVTSEEADMKKARQATYCDIKNIIDAIAEKEKTLKNANTNIALKYLFGKDYIELMPKEYNFTSKGNSFKVANFSKNYQFGFVENGLLYTYFNESNTNLSRQISKVYFKEIITETIPTDGLYMGVNKENMKSYLKGYGDTISYYLDHDDTNQLIPVSANDKEKDCEKDFKGSIYLSLKNLWDRWLCGFYNQKEENTQDTNYVSGKDYFKVENFFCKYFYFIDSFYVNVYDKIRLNCDKLLQIYQSGDENNMLKEKKVVNHLGSVAAEHKCMMFNFPDGLNFSEIDANTGKVRNVDMTEELATIFKPMPASHVQQPESMNRFVTIYANSANILDTANRNSFIPDSFDIFSQNDGQNVCPAIFKCKCEGIGESQADRLANNSRVAYKVPAFGVAYSRQNNSYWKNVDVGMDNMSVTEQAIKAQAYIAEMGNTNQRKVCFYGQDVYSLYQMYSYLVTVEMLGNAQIQPLMYFQLMNIPMFRGTYMIIRVEHTITRGNMITKFTGVKMSRKQPPFTTAWFTVAGDDESGGITDRNADNADDGDAMVATDGYEIDIADNDFSKAINKYLGQEMACDEFVIKVFGDVNIEITRRLKDGV